MIAPTFESQGMDQLEVDGKELSTQWLWHGYLASGSLTLLTSQWKAGKTTLVTGLLQRLGDGKPFLDRPCQPAKCLVVSEESREHWHTRLKAMPVGSHSRLMPRPFIGRPTPEAWNRLVDHAAGLREAHELDLLVVDPLASFLPGHSESDPGTLLTMLQPLQRLAGMGVAVLILHHPRKKPSDEGCSARGSGALLGFVDIILELNHFGRMPIDNRRRKLIGLSRYEATPTRLYYEWEPETSTFRVLQDPHQRRFQDNWPRVRKLLERYKVEVSHKELLQAWPEDSDKPTVNTLYDWLNQAWEEKLLRRIGTGKPSDPFRYRLPNKKDEYIDRGEMPPLELPWMNE